MGTTADIGRCVIACAQQCTRFRRQSGREKAPAANDRGSRVDKLPERTLMICAIRVAKLQFQPE